MAEPQDSLTDNQLDEHVDALVQEMSGLAEEHEPEPAAEPGEGEAESLDGQVEAMLTEAVEQAEVESPAPVEGEASDQPPEVENTEPESSSPDTVEDLDAELADLADELLEGDFDDVDDVLAAGNPTEPIPPPEPEAAEAAEDEQAPASEPASPEPAADAEPGTDAEPSQATEPEPGSVADQREPDEAPVEARAPTETAALDAAPGGLKHRLTTAVYEAAVAANKPLDAKPTYARDIVGWFAAVTLFNALAVWVFFLLVRSPDPGPSPADVVTLEVPAEASAAEITDPG